MTAAQLSKHLCSLGDPQRALGSARFFKTGIGEYGEGDQFLGITVPMIRVEVKRFAPLPLATLEELVASPWHEIRLFAWLSLVAVFEKSSIEDRLRCYHWLIKHVRWLNNWDLVDTTVPRVVGWLPLEETRKQLDRWLVSPKLWERRIAIVSTLGLLRQGITEPSLTFAKVLLKDTHDLIHKATGWVLREVGKKDEKQLRKFLKEERLQMPRTMLRYAIERFSVDERRAFLKRSSE